jgi:hypothetical protein
MDATAVRVITYPSEANLCTGSSVIMYPDEANLFTGSSVITERSNFTGQSKVKAKGNVSQAFFFLKALKSNLNH